MSARIKKSSVAPTPSKNPYCKVCHAAGKPESVYTSHWVKSLPDRNGNTTITCETLLSVECRWCYNVGHTAGYCPVLKQNNKEKERAERIQKAKEAEAASAKKPKAAKKPASMFAVLADDSSESEVEEEIVSKVSNKVSSKVSENIKMTVEEFPALCVSAAKNEVKSGWADALAKPKQEQFAVRVRVVEKAKEPVAAQLNANRYAKYLDNWACTDTDDDDDEPVAAAPSTTWSDDEDW